MSALIKKELNPETAHELLTILDEQGLSYLSIKKLNGRRNNGKIVVQYRLEKSVDSMDDDVKMRFIQEHIKKYLIDVAKGNDSLLEVFYDESLDKFQIKNIVTPKEETHSE